jgi:hypothetical protein
VTRDEILAAVVAERERQEVLWGEQNHPDVPPSESWDRDSFAVAANSWKKRNEARAASGELAWDGILLEEVYEALAEEDPEKLRTELLQSMAVILNWLECISRRYGEEAA